MNARDLRNFFLSIVLPSILAIVLFIISFYVLIIPSFEKSMMESKKEMIRELTNSALSLLNEYYQDYSEGILDGEQAKQHATEIVSMIRYGDEKKDYFWITDMRPYMVMHPYRRELNGTDLSEYTDPTGKRLFIDAVDIVKRNGEGYIDYMWQWKDDSTLIVPKLSYVKGFSGWGWIIGTGIYLEDVKEEIRTLERNILWITFIVIVLITIVLLYIVRQSMMIESRREEAEQKLLLSRQKYKTLVESSTIGTLMMSENKIIYANMKFLEITGCQRERLNEYTVEDLFELEWQEITGSFKDPGISVNMETRMKSKDNQINILLSVSRVTYNARSSYIMVINELSGSTIIERKSMQLKEDLQSLLLLMNQPITSYISTHQTSNIDCSILEAAKLLEHMDKQVLQQNFIAQLYIGIEKAEDVSRLREIYLRMTVVVMALINSGAKPEVVTRLISSFTDKVNARIIEMAIRQSGPPPCSFCFIAMGSQGRSEQTLATDQDNGIIIDDNPTRKEEAEKYFTDLGERITADLNWIGYKYCKGNVMASNPKWIKSLKEWKEQFKTWINDSDTHSLMEVNIFFDFKPIFGESVLSEELRVYINKLVDGKGVFFYHLSQEVTRFKTPFNIFGHIVGESGTHDNRFVDFKKILMPVMGFARLYSLKAMLDDTNTIERLDRLRDRGDISDKLALKVKEAYKILMEIRFRAQVESLINEGEASNSLDINDLSEIEVATIRKVLSLINELITKTGLDFQGTI